MILALTLLILAACITYWVFSVIDWNKRCAEARKRFIAGELDTPCARGLYSGKR